MHKSENLVYICGEASIVNKIGDTIVSANFEQIVKDTRDGKSSDALKNIFLCAKKSDDNSISYDIRKPISTLKDDFPSPTMSLLEKVLKKRFPQ